MRAPARSALLRAKVAELEKEISRLEKNQPS